MNEKEYCEDLVSQRAHGVWSRGGVGGEGRNREILLTVRTLIFHIIQGKKKQ